MAGTPAGIVVAVSHLGYTAQDKKDVTDPQIAAASSDIDIIIGGHSHTDVYKRQTVNPVQP